MRACKAGLSSATGSSGAWEVRWPRTAAAVVVPGRRTGTKPAPRAAPRQRPPKRAGRPPRALGPGRGAEGAPQAPGTLAPVTRWPHGVRAHLGRSDRGRRRRRRSYGVWRPLGGRGGLWGAGRVPNGGARGRGRGACGNRPRASTTQAIRLWRKPERDRRLEPPPRAPPPARRFTPRPYAIDRSTRPDLPPPSALPPPSPSGPLRTPTPPRAAAGPPRRASAVTPRDVAPPGPQRLLLQGAGLPRIPRQPHVPQFL
jgi:hypothetical protein